MIHEHLTHAQAHVFVERHTDYVLVPAHTFATVMSLLFMVAFLEVAVAAMRYRNRDTIKLRRRRNDWRD